MKVQGSREIRVRIDECMCEKKLEKNTGKSRAGVELSRPITSHSKKKLDEVILLWPKSQKPIFPLEAIFIFPFRVYWWFHKNS